jgi:hypothetical protein
MTLKIKLHRVSIENAVVKDKRESTKKSIGNVQTNERAKKIINA